MSETAVQPQPVPSKPELSDDTLDWQLADQSFVTYEGDLASLGSIEKLVAKYADGLARKLGKNEGVAFTYEAIPATDTGTGQGQTGFFRHGIINACGNSWEAKGGEGPQGVEDFALNFPLMPAQAKVTVIESSEELILARGEEGPRVIDVSSGSHLIVFGNVVCIRGKISIPGKHIVIFARELKTVAKGDDGAELNVDGEVPQAAALPPADRATDGGPGTVGTCTLSAGGLGEPVVKMPGTGGRGDPGKDGQPGAPGKFAGAIYIVCDTLQMTSKLALSAAGGDGQGGQNGQKGGSGGPGGAGAIKEANRYHIVVKSGYGGPGGPGGRGGPGGAGGDSGDCVAIFNKAISGEDLSGNAIKVVNQPGAQGAGGQRGADGDRGPRGSEPSYDPALPGYWTVYEDANPGFGTSPNVADLPDPPPARWGRSLVVHDVQALTQGNEDDHPFNDLRGLARISHLQMVMETVRARYLEWDACRIAKDRRAGERPVSSQADPEAKVKEELLGLLDFLELGRRLLGYGLKTEQTARDKISAALARWPMQIAHGLDYFGNPDNFVPEPLGPPGVHLKSLKEGLTTLEKWEKDYLAYRGALFQHSQTGMQRGKATKVIDQWMTTLKDDYNKRRLDLIGMVTTDIPDARKKVTETQGKLSDALVNLKTWVDNCFGLTPEDFIETVFNMAFMGSPVGAGGAISKHGLFTTGTTLSSQSAKLISKAVQTLPNDEGIPVNRKSLITRIDMFSKKLTNLREAFQMVRDATNPSGPEIAVLEDKEAYRLLVVQQDFDALLDQFSTKAEAQAAVAAMDDYVNAIQERNAVLDQYNTMVLDYLRIAADMHTGASQLKTIEDLNAAGAKPDLASETAFISALYNRMREHCIEYYYRASRAYSFWALKPDDSLRSTLNLGSINQVDSKALKAAEEELLFQRTTGIRSQMKGEGDKPPFHFPPLAADYAGGGVLFPLKPGPDLEIMSVKTIDELPDTGHEMVYLALVHDQLHVRIFDENRQKVVDKPEPELLQGESLTALKTLLSGWLNSFDSDVEQKLDPDVKELNLIGEAISLLTNSPIRLRPNRYRLVLMSDDQVLPDQGVATIIVAVNRRSKGFHIRIFNENRDTVPLGASEWLEETSSGPEGQAAWKILKNTLPYFPDQKDEDEIRRKAGIVAGYSTEGLYLSMLVGSMDDIPAKGRSTVIVALVSRPEWRPEWRSLHLRIFDDQGQRVIDKNAKDLTDPQPAHPEGEMIQLVNELKTHSTSVLRNFLLEPKEQRRLLHDLSLHLNFASVIGPPFGEPSLFLAWVKSLGDLQNEGRNAVILAMVGDSLRIRIFNQKGDKSVDLGEQQLGAEDGDRLAKLSFVKDLLLRTESPKKFVERLISKRKDELISTAASLAGRSLMPRYRKELAQLRDTGVATFTVPPPAKNSTKADNPFWDYCNVRLKRVRAWVDGISDGLVEIRLRHKGDELVRAPDKSLVPFVHTFTEGRFKYEAGKLAWDSTGHVANPDVAMKHGIDGDFPLVRIEGDTENFPYLKNIGPFTDWEIEVLDGDKSKINAIYLEFHGIAQNPD